jgi:hypothetical protein
MFDHRNEDAEYEFNARYDYVREAYGDAADFNNGEAYCDYLDECAFEGVEALDRAAWEADCAARAASRATARALPSYDAEADLPF